MRRSRAFVSYAIPTEPKRKVKRIYASDQQVVRTSFVDTVKNQCVNYGYNNEAFLGNVDRLISMISNNSKTTIDIKKKNVLTLAASFIVLLNTYKGIEFNELFWRSLTKSPEQEAIIQKVDEFDPIDIIVENSPVLQNVAVLLTHKINPTAEKGGNVDISTALTIIHREITYIINELKFMQ